MKTLHGIQEVSGSIPLISTKRKALKPLYINGFGLFLISENLLQNESVNKKCQQIQKNFVVCSFFALFFGRLQGAIFRNAFYSKMPCKGLEKF